MNGGTRASVWTVTGDLDRHCVTGILNDHGTTERSVWWTLCDWIPLDRILDLHVLEVYIFDLSIQRFSTHSVECHKLNNVQLNAIQGSSSVLYSVRLAISPSFSLDIRPAFRPTLVLILALQFAL